MEDYTQKYVDRIMSGLSVKGMTKETRSRLASSLRSMLITRINNKIYKSLSYEQLIDLYQRMNDADDGDKVIADYLDGSGVNVVAIAEQAYRDLSKEYRSTMAERLISVGRLA